MKRVRKGYSGASLYNGESVGSQVVANGPVQEGSLVDEEIDPIWGRGTGGKPGNQSLSLKKFLRIVLHPPAHLIRLCGRRFMRFLYPELSLLDQNRRERVIIPNSLKNSRVAHTAKLYSPYHIQDSSVAEYCGIARNSWITMTSIGKFCSIGPNFVCGWGIHPTNGLSTSPMFYSTRKQNGFSLCKANKIQERKPITIGNDVYIGMNVAILDGVTVGDGAVIGAGCVVRGNVPPYTTAVGNPMKILPRFPKRIVTKLREIAWWDWPDEKLREVEKYFFEVEKFCDDFAEASHQPEADAGADNGGTDA